MNETADTPRGIAPGPVTDWLVANVPDVRAPLDFALIAGGHSNLTYRVTDAAGRRLVLRRPPLGAVLATAHDMGREHRIIAALAGSFVPVPPALGLCSDSAVNGAPFYVMAFVDGVVLDLRATVDRTEFGVSWNIPLPTGEPALGNEVTIVAGVQLVKAA